MNRQPTGKTGPRPHGALAPGTTPGPLDDAEVADYLERLGVPGIADIHVHFMPEPMLRKVWDYFDQAEDVYGTHWPIRYRLSEEERIARLRSLGVRDITALSYAHKAGMSAWLNEWSEAFAERVVGAVHSATFYPEPGVTAEVARVLAAGARVFKVHVQVGTFAPDDPVLDDAWGLIEESGMPVVIHAGSAPLPGRHTGPAPVRRLLKQHPLLTLVVAHLGMPEYHAFADLVEEFPNVHLDTTMAATDFTEAMTPMPADYRVRLGRMRDRVVFGSDFPNIPYAYAHQIEALTRLGHGDDWMRAVLWHNGARLLGMGAR